MAGETRNAVLRDVQTLFDFGVVRDLSDPQLLERFLTADHGAAEAAFTVLVERHGPLVLHVCRQVLDDSHDAQDAFQATFLVFLRRAGSIRNRDSLASWLFGVAMRVARRARYTAIVRRFHERCAGEIAATRAAATSGHSVRLAALQEEIARLPQRYREPILLCHLEGLSTAAAARRLGCAHGTILSRLARARERLRRRLTERGRVELAGLFVGARVSQEAMAPLPAALVNSTVQPALHALAGRTALTAMVTPSVIALTQSTLRTLIMTRIALAAALLATAAFVAAVTIPAVRSSQGIDNRVLEIPIPPGDPVSAGQSSPAQAATQQHHGIVRRPGDRALTVGYSSDGKTLATAGFDGVVQLWDMINDRRIGRLKGEKSTIRSVTFAPDARTVACVNDAGLVRLWDVATGGLKQTLPGLSESMRQAALTFMLDSIAFAPDGHLLAVSGFGPTNAEWADRFYELRVFDVKPDSQYGRTWAAGNRHARWPLRLTVRPWRALA